MSWTISLSMWIGVEIHFCSKHGQTAGNTNPHCLCKCVSPEIWLGFLQGWECISQGGFSVSDKIQLKTHCPDAALFFVTGSMMRLPHVCIVYYYMNINVTLNWFLVAEGILVSNGLIWKHQRHFGIGALRKLGMRNKGMERGIQTEAGYLVEFFRDKAGTALVGCLVHWGFWHSASCVWL